MSERSEFDSSHGSIFCFHGRFIPDRANIEFGQNDLRFRINSKGYSVSFQGYDSECLGEIHSEEPISAFDASRIANAIVKNLTYRLSFLNGSAYDFEIVSIRDLKRQSTYFPPVFEPFLFDTFDEMQSHGKREHGYLVNEKWRSPHPMIDTALRLFNHAMRDQALTPLFCYLAIEALAYGFSQIEYQHEIRQLSKSDWARFNDKLDISSDDIYSKIKPLADKMRHGKFSNLDWADRKDCLAITWKIISKSIKIAYSPDFQSAKTS